MKACENCLFFSKLENVVSYYDDFGVCDLSEKFFEILDGKGEIVVNKRFGCKFYKPKKEEKWNIEY